jgi:hypothetical protein
MSEEEALARIKENVWDDRWVRNVLTEFGISRYHAGYEDGLWME